jgi:hypothetical protein
MPLVKLPITELPFVILSRVLDWGDPLSGTRPFFRPNWAHPTETHFHKRQFTSIETHSEFLKFFNFITAICRNYTAKNNSNAVNVPTSISLALEIKSIVTRKN